MKKGSETDLGRTPNMWTPADTIVSCSVVLIVVF